MSEKKNNSTQSKDEKRTGVSLKTQKRFLSIISVCLVLAGAILLNIISSVLTDKYAALTADITSNSLYNIGEDSVEIAQKLKKDVKITFLTDKNSYEAYDTYCKQATNIADQLKKYSDGKISVEYMDLVKNPNIQNKYQEENLSVTDVIVSCADRYNILKRTDMFNFETYGDYQYITSSRAESALDTAILKVSSENVTTVGLINDYAIDDYSVLKKVLDSNNYKVKELSVERDDIPSDINTVIAFAPSKDYSKDAVDKLRSYLKNDGKYGRNLIFIAYAYEVECPNITALLSEYGMQLEDGLAFETNTSRMTSMADGYSNIAAGFSEQMLYISNYDQKKDYPVLVSRSRAVKITDERIAVPLLEYSSKSGICPYSAGDDWKYEDYLIEYVPVAAQGISGGDSGLSRLIFSGSSEMWTTLLQQQNFTNKKYIFNILNELNSRQDPGVYLDDKVITNYDLSSVDVSTKRIAGFIVYAAAPVLILIAGLCVFLIRRRK